MADSTITALVQRIADSVPFVVRVEWEPELAKKVIYDQNQ